MRKRKTIKRVAPLLAVALLVPAGLAGCSEQTGEIEVWSTYNTLKVMQSLHDYPKLEAKLSAELAIGETEGAQLLYTPEKDVESFELIAGELRSGDHIFNPDNVQIYVQKYLNVLLKTYQQKNDAYPTGYTPDFLLPMSLAKEYGENNSLAGNNQGFYVEFTTDENTRAGVYTGSFQLKTDGKTTEIPVSVTVYDVGIAHSYGKSSFGLYQDTLMHGEMDSSDEMYTKYYETLMRDYKVMLMHVPYALEIDKFADSVIKYYDEPTFTSYGIPTFGGGVQGFDADAFNDYVYEIAKRCTPEKTYLEKAYVYPLMADEPTNNEKREIMKTVTATRDALDEVIVARLDAEGFFDDYGGVEGDFAKAMTEVLDKLPCVITTDAIESFGEEVDTYCPPIQYFSTDYLRGLYEEHEARNSGETWFYTCMQPIYPYPSHHIDDYLIGSRSMRWMQMAYGLEGYLYWHTSYYVKDENYVDCYNDPIRYLFNGAPYNGDGYLTYPGAKYDYEGPLPSLRLVCYRDGQEDYDLFCTYEEMLQATYGDAVDVNKVFGTSYASLFAGTIYNTSDADFATERNLLLERAEALGSATGLVAYVDDDGAKSKLIVYAKTGSEIYVNGDKVSTEAFDGGVKYTADITKDVTVKATNGETASEYTLAVGVDKREVALTASSLQMSDTSTAVVGENGLELTVYGKGDTLIEINSFKPGFYINATTLGGNLNGLDYLEMELYNHESKAYPIEVVLNMKDGSTITLEKYTLKTGANTVTIRNIPLYYGYTGKKVDKLRVIFPNSENNVIVAERKATLNKLFYAKKGE